LSADGNPGPATDAELAQALATGSARLGVPQSRFPIDRFVAYLRFVERWNATYNLTAVRDPRDMVAHHILDCLAAAEALRRRLGPGPGERVLDVGSGAGLPGIVLAATCPETNVVCIDSVGKKAAFITQAAAMLGLDNVTTLHARVEAIRDRRFDVITSRAFAALSDFVRLTRPLLAPGGTWMALKGEPSVQELAALGGFPYVVERLTIPTLEARRCVVWISAEQAHAYD
jgi:16S rRNA (guanine527-N7)-methyltransferase